MTSVGKAWNDLLDSLRVDTSTPPRQLRDADLVGWNESLSERARRQPKPETWEEVRRAIQMSNPVRWGHLQSELRWLKKKMKKMGLNPDDARYLL